MVTLTDTGDKLAIYSHFVVVFQAIKQKSQLVPSSIGWLYSLCAKCENISQ